MARDIAPGLELGGSYRLICLLGKGGMGQVWEADHIRLPKQVAIKFLLADHTLEEEWFARFQREAEIASRLQHPHIIDVQDYNVLEDGTPYIVMERLHGEDLRRRLSRGAIPLPEAKLIVQQIISALTVAHNAGVVHRDLKPENIFLCQVSGGPSHAKVLDFGISKLQQPTPLQLTQTRALLGTPGYMSPEQVSGQAHAVTARTDLFSLAIIFYEMLTGQVVFQGDSLMELVYKLAHYRPPPLREILPQVPIEISDAVERALSTDPAQRQASLMEFGSELQERRPQSAASAARDAGPRTHTEDRRTSAGADNASAPSVAPTVPAQTRSGLLLAGAAIALLLVAGGLWAMGSDGGPQAAAISAGIASEHASKAEAPDEAPLPVASNSVPSRSPSEVSATGAGLSAEGATRDANADSSSVANENEGVAAGEPIPTGLAPKQPNKSQPNKSQRDTSESGISTTQADRVQLSPAARAQLEAARHALAQDDFRGALHTARTSLREGQSQEAFRLMTVAYCGLRDLGMAQAMARNLRGQSLRKARARCAVLGVKL